MSQHESISVVEYDFTAKVTKGHKLITRFPCSYYLSWKFKEQSEIKEVFTDNKLSADEDGQVNFDCEIKITAHLIYSGFTKTYNSKKTNICLYYVSAQKPDKSNIAGSISIDLSKLVNANQQPMILPLQKTPLKQGQLQITISSKKMKDLQLSGFNQPQEQNSLTNSIRSLSNTKNQKTAQNTNKKFTEDSVDTCEIKVWSICKDKQLDTKSIKSIDSHSNAPSQSVKKLKTKIKQLQLQISLQQQQISYQKIRNQGLIKQFQSIQSQNQTLKIKNKQNEQHILQNKKQLQDINIIMSSRNLELQILNKQKQQNICMIQQLNNTIQQQIFKINQLTNCLSSLSSIKEQNHQLIEQNKQLKQSQPNTEQLLIKISNLQKEQFKITERVAYQQQQIFKYKQLMKKSETDYNSILTQNKYILQTLEKISQDFINKQKQADKIRAEYEAYRLHKTKRRQFKQKQKIQTLQGQVQQLVQQIMRLNEQMFSYRQVQMENNSMKKQLQALMNQVQNLKQVSNKQQVSKQQQIDKVYVNQLNKVINELKLQQGKLNQKLIVYEKQNQLLKDLNPTVLKQIISLLKNRLYNNTNDDLILMFQKEHNLRKVNSSVLNHLIDQIRQSLYQITKIKNIQFKNNENKQLLIQSLHSIEQKLNNTLII